MLTLTEKAKAMLDRLIASADAPTTGLRIAIDAGSCSGLQYGMALVDKPAENDVVVNCGAAKIYIDPGSVALIAGTTVDFIESLEGAGFSFSNPNALGRCACGRSSMA